MTSGVNHPEVIVPWHTGSGYPQTIEFSLQTDTKQDGVIFRNDMYYLEMIQDTGSLAKFKFHISGSGVAENGSPPSGLPGAGLNKGSLTATTSTLFDRTLDVYGVKLLVGGASGTQDAVPDSWAYKVAQSYVMLMDPTGSNIDVSAQEKMKEILLPTKNVWRMHTAT